jgi:Mrp family chromosome partitioning ATPase
LSAALRLALPAGPTPRIVLVTSATHADGKTTVTARLGRALADAGNDTLLISGDLRWSKLDGAFGVTGRPGLRELLAQTPDVQMLSRSRAARRPALMKELEDVILPVNGQDSQGKLDILPVGQRRDDSSELLPTAALQSLIDSVRVGRRYSYVLIDTTPILGVADAQLLAQFCDRLLLVARLDRLKLSDVVDLRDTLNRLDCEAVGIVVIGTRVAVTPYSWTGLRSQLARAPASRPERPAGVGTPPGPSS